MKQYLEMMQHVRENGVYKSDRTGTGTYSVFGYQMRFDLSDGSFPLVTTKQCHLKSIIHELLWFLQGETNIRYLKEHGVSIWDEWVLEGTEEYRPATLREVNARIKAAGLQEEFIEWVKPYWLSEYKEGYEKIQGKTMYVKDGPDIPGSIYWAHPDYDVMAFTWAEERGVSTKTLIAGELGPVYGSQWRNWPAAQQSTIDALMKLACLGARDGHWGNSEGNQIAQDALFKIPGIVHNKKVYMASGLTYEQWVGRCAKMKSNYTETGGVDQIANLIDTLKNNPDSRRIIVSAWNPHELDQMALHPCHCLFQFYTSPLTGMERWVYGLNHGYFEENEGRGQFGLDEFLDQKGVPTRKLSCQLYQRSADIGLGVPFNIASYALLLMMVAQVTDHALGEFIWTGGDCHIYSNHLEQIDLQLTRDPHPLPTMKINPQVRDIFDFKYEDFTLENYVSHPHIAMPVAV